MKMIARGLLVVVGLIVLVSVIAYADGASLPVEHSVTVHGTVNAPPEKVFSLITNVGAGAGWRHEVKSVQMLEPEAGQDRWVEYLGHGVTMKFIATKTVPLDASGHATRDVLLKDPSFGGTWTYDLQPGPTTAQTALTITEAGYVNPPIYRFMMAHVFGMTKNLEQYMTDVQAAAR